MRKKIVQVLLSLMLIVAFMPTLTFAETPTDPDIPEWESSMKELMDVNNDGNVDETSDTNPYGKPIGQPFMLAEQTELFKFINNNDNEDKPIFDAAIYDGMKAGNTHTGRVTDLFDKKTGVVVPNGTSIKDLNFTKAVSFDPTGCGRDDHIAVVGIDKDKFTWLYVYSTYTKNWSEGIKLEDFWWVQDGTKHPSEFYEMTNFISITAGDYDGDCKDSLVVFLASESKSSGNIDSYGLTEVKCSVEDTSKKITLSYDSKNQKDLLNPSYVENYKKIREPYKDYGYGMIRLKGVVGTGDFNGDTIEDLAVMTYTEGEDFEGDVKAFVPYLGVSYGEKGTTAITNTLGDGEYVHESATSPYTTMTDAGMTVVDTDDEGADDIVVAGRYAEWKFDKNFTAKYTEQKSKALNIAKYGFNKNKLVKKYIKKNGTDGQGNAINFNLNGWSGNQGTGWVDRAPISVQGVYMNGPLNPAYIEIGGDIFDCSEENVVKKIYNFNYLHDYRGHHNFIPNVAAGNFDGNEYGYEQIVFTLGERANNDTYYMSFGMVGIDNSKRDEKTEMVPADQLSGAFYETGAAGCETYEIKNYKAWLKGYQMSCMVVPVDSDNDGTLARYSKRTINYTDPKPVAILQAAPYFGDLRENSGCYSNDANGVGSTTLKYVDQVGKGEGLSAGTSISEGQDANIGIRRLSGSKSAEEAEKKNGSFSATYRHSNSMQFTAAGTNQVIVARVPLYFYTYDIFKADPTHPEERDSWYEDAYSVSTTHAAKFVSIEESQYNSFVAQYNPYMQQVVNAYNYYVDQYNVSPAAADQKPVEKMVYDDVKMTELNVDDSGLGTAGQPKTYLKDNAKMDALELNDITESEVSVPHGMATQSISTANELEASKIRGTSTGKGINYSKTKGKSYKGGGKHYFGSYENGSASLGTTYSAENSKRIEFGIMLAGITPCTGYSADDLAKYSMSCRLAQWKSNIPTGGNPEDGTAIFVNVPVFGSDITQLKEPVKVPDTLAATRETLQGDAPQKMTINWNGEIADGQKFGIYLYGKDDYELVSTTTNKTFTYEPTKELPVYQFRVGILDANDKLISLSSHPVYVFAERYFEELISMDIKPEKTKPSGERASNDFVITVNKTGGNVKHENKSITDITAGGVDLCKVKFNDGTTDSTADVKFKTDMGQKIDLTKTTCDKNNELSDKYEFTLMNGDKCYILVPNIKHNSGACVHEYVLKNFVAPSDVDGYSGDWKCIKCGDVKKGTTVKKLFTASLAKTGLTYNGQEQRPTVKVVDGDGNPLVEGTDYTITWAVGSKNVGPYSVRLNIKRGRFQYDRALAYNIIPKGTTLSKLKPAKKSLSVKWKKQSMKMSMSNVTGYEVQYALDSKFKKSVKKANVKGFKKTSKKIKKLKAKKKYYVRIRTYLKTGGKIYYSSWSKAKNAKVK